MTVSSMPAVAASSPSSGEFVESSEETNELRPPANNPNCKQIQNEWININYSRIFITLTQLQDGKLS